jgi:hypothetical protein
VRREALYGVGTIALGAVLVGLACGGDNAEAPGPVYKNAQALKCRSFAQLVPNFLAFIDSGRTANLACVVKAHLLVGRTPDDPPPINDVLRAVFALLNGFAHEPAELNAVPGTQCAPDADETLWPPPDQANQLCEMRRTLYTLIHKGEGIDAVNLIAPDLSGVIDYITGKGKDMTPHYEVSGVVSRMCSQNAQCQISDTLDVLVALSAYLQDSAGKKTLMDLKDLVNSPGIQMFLNSSAPNSLTEDGAVALAKVAIPAIQSASPDDLQNLLDQPPLNTFKDTLQPVVDDVKIVMMTPALYNPLKRVLTCLTWADTNYELIRMLYRLGLRDALPQFGITALAMLFDNLQGLDPRGALVHLLGTVASAVRADPTAVDSAASVCQTLFSTAIPEGQAQSNAQLGLPVLDQLFQPEVGLVPELICALDTLIYGCMDGPAADGGVGQPACGNMPPPLTLGQAPPPAMCPGNACCTHCGSQQPCGDSCISPEMTCGEQPGCACK